MSTLKEEIKELKEQGDFDPDECTICTNPTHVKDAIGFPWCENHAHRGQILSWGYRHHYPALPYEGLRMGRHAIAASENSWWIVATLGNDDLVWLVVIYTEHLDILEREKKAS